MSVGLIFLRNLFRCKKKIFLESTAIVVVGVILHVNKISMIEMQRITLPILIPNIASLLVTISLICLLNMIRPLWPGRLRHPQTTMKLAFEASIILYTAEFLLRQIWIPCLKALSYGCGYIADGIQKNNINFIWWNGDNIANWFRIDAYYALRFVLAVLLFWGMLDTTRVFSRFMSLFRDPSDVIIINREWFPNDVCESPSDERFLTHSILEHYFKHHASKRSLRNRNIVWCNGSEERY